MLRGALSEVVLISHGAYQQIYDHSYIFCFVHLKLLKLDKFTK